MQRDARAVLVPWASAWMHVTTVDGLAGAARVRNIAAGHVDPLAAVVIRP
jgi:hypothetical protein